MIYINLDILLSREINAENNCIFFIGILYL